MTSEDAIRNHPIRMMTGNRRDERLARENL
jgi:hypothetical protein